MEQRESLQYLKDEQCGQSSVKGYSGICKYVKWCFSEHEFVKHVGVAIVRNLEISVEWALSENQFYSRHTAAKFCSPPCLKESGVERTKVYKPAAWVLGVENGKILIMR